MMSSDKSFYRYQVNSADDLSRETFERRSKKARQNNKNGFFFEINEIFPILRDLVSANDAVLSKLEIYNRLANLLECELYYIRIETLTELADFLKHFEKNIDQSFNLLLTPKTTAQMKVFCQFYKDMKEKINVFWRF